MRDSFFSVIFLSALLCSSSCFAQNLFRDSSSQTMEDAIAKAASWQLTLDVIQAKSQAVLNKNLQLTQDNQSLQKEYIAQQEALRALFKKNEEIKEQIKQRRGRSDEQMKIDQLQEEIKAKKEKLKSNQQELSAYEQELKAMQQKIELKKLKNAAVLLDRKEEVLYTKIENQAKEKQAAEDDQELVDLRQKFEQEKEQEKILEKQIDALKQAQKVSSHESQSDQQRIEELLKRVDYLTKQKDDLQKRLNSDNNQANKARFNQLMMRKGELEQKIKESEVHLSQLKRSSGLNLSETKSNKILLKQTAQMDARNKQLQHKIGNLNEDILLLRTQIKRLERKVYQRVKTTSHKK